MNFAGAELVADRIAITATILVVLAIVTAVVYLCRRRLLRAVSIGLGR